MSLTTAEAAAALGITPPAIRKLVERRKLEPVRRGVRPLEFDEATIRAFASARWRAQQRIAGARLIAAGREFDRLVAAQVRPVSR